MLKVFKLADSQFQVQFANGLKLGGTVSTICRIMYEHGITFREIERGLVQLQNTSHNVADYGVDRTFIYSKRMDN